MGQKRDLKVLSTYLDEDERIFLYAPCKLEEKNGIVGVTQNRILFTHKPLMKPAYLDMTLYENIDYVLYTEGTGEGELSIHLNSGDIKYMTSHQLIHLKGVSDIVRMFVNNHQRDLLFRNTFNRKQFLE
ncbi:PH domain-containing protein [Terribacillus sp. DMT04]|uniref:PH domain-containing protein n=1 Tax=Terribacillus sp. DMT04 TaxID=2850441 RepID=UPI001C2B942F|nr:PH domain-containing protein [Terribacillus sp. DMT04]QXE01644.1 PH domain-containing protein [Terribacillus sp. DMT04]